MDYKKTYQNIIWTNHALQRLKERKMSQEQAWKAFRYPDSTKKGKRSGSKIFQKKFNELTLTVIAQQNNKREWIVVSCWIDPPLPGSIDIKKKKEYWQYQEMSTFGKLWFHLKKLILG